MTLIPFLGERHVGFAMRRFETRQCFVRTVARSLAGRHTRREKPEESSSGLARGVPYWNAGLLRR